MPINPTQALDLLYRQPEQFLKRYPVRIFGDPTGSHVSQYRIEERHQLSSYRPGSVLGTLNMHETQLFEIRAQDSAMGKPPGSVWFDAHSVKMFESNKPHDIVIYRLAGTGPDLMVTGQLSGCSFAIRDNGNGSMDVAHIRPNAQLTSEILQSTLQRTGAWHIVYGREDYSSQRRASIIGVRVGIQWQIYAQKQDGTTEDYRVKKVKRLI
jgi:hypothetical protein